MTRDPANASRRLSGPTTSSAAGLARGCRRIPITRIPSARPMAAHCSPMAPRPAMHRVRPARWKALPTAALVPHALLLAHHGALEIARQHERHAPEVLATQFPWMCTFVIVAGCDLTWGRARRVSTPAHFTWSHDKVSRLLPEERGRAE